MAFGTIPADRHADCRSADDHADRRVVWPRQARGVRVSRYYVIVFRVIVAERDGRFREAGGGAAFFPEPRPDGWHALIAAMVAARFRRTLGPCVEVGYATLDAGLLELHCQRELEFYWQGGEELSSAPRRL